jgi:hypothetical protein
MDRTALYPVHRLIFKIVFKMRDRMVLHPVNRLILKIVFKMRDRMALHPVHRLILKILFKMRDGQIFSYNPRHPYSKPHQRTTLTHWPFTEADTDSSYIALQDVAGK